MTSGRARRLYDVPSRVTDDPDLGTTATAPSTAPSRVTETRTSALDWTGSLLLTDCCGYRKPGVLPQTAPHGRLALTIR